MHFYFSQNLEQIIFDDMPTPKIFDEALIQYMSFHRIIEQRWVSYVRVVPLDGLLNGVPVEWGWTKVKFHWFDQAICSILIPESDQYQFQLLAPNSEAYLEHVIAETPDALIQIVDRS